MADMPSVPPRTSAEAQPRVARSDKPPSVFRNFFRDSVWQFLGGISAGVVNVAMYVVAVRLLGRAEFGAFGVVYTAGAFCASLLGFGARNTLMILAGRSRHGDKGTVVASCYLYLAATALGTWLLVRIDPPGPGSWTMSALSPDLGLLIVLYTTMQAFFVLWGSMLRGADRYRSANVLAFGQQVALAVGVIAGICLSAGSVGAVWGGTAGMFVLAVGVTAVGVSRWGIRLPRLKSFLQAGGSVGVRSYVASVCEVTAEAFGVFYLGSRGDLVGVAALVGCQRMAALLGKPGAIVNPVLKGKVAGQTSGEWEARRVLQLSRLTFLLGAAATVPLLVFARPFTVLALGPGYDDAVTVMVLILLAQAFRAHAVPASGFLLGKGCPASYVVLRIAATAATIAGVLALSPTMGAVGVALVYCATSLAAAIGVTAILVGEAKSVKSVFVGDDLVLLGRFSHAGSLLFHPKRA